MRRSIAVVVLIVGMLGCASRRPAVTLADASRTQYGVMLISGSGMAQGCPVGRTTMLTARHVAERRGLLRTTSAPTMWSDDGGRTGYARPQEADNRRDLAIMVSSQSFGRWYAIAQDAPTIGQEVEIRGYDFANWMRKDIVKVKIKNIVAAHLVVEPGGRRGFSGSCVVNEAGDLVGIFVWGVTSGTSEMGIAVGVWGEWSPLRPTESEMPRSEQ